MGDKETQQGMLIIVIATFFLLSALEVLDYVFIDAHFSALAAFVLVAVGVYLITKK